MNDDLEKALEKRTLKNIHVELFEIVQQHEMSYMEAIVFYCEENDMDIEYLAGFIKKNELIVAKIRDEAESLNYLEKSSKLPI